jgi:sirohydrochlorin cobaltochelatase
MIDVGDVAMSISVDESRALETLESRLKLLLPEEYRDSYEDLQPVSMGSAGLKYAKDGSVAWDEIWSTFCDLAMAGGPPHKGTLLEPGGAADIDAQPERYEEVATEICRGIWLAAELQAKPSPHRGWVRVACYNEAMAGWLLRAIVMENVAARRQGAALDLPAAPHFRLEKEIKNVITVIAKTCHYWMGHMPRTQRLAIADLFARMADESPLVEPLYSTDAVSGDTYEMILRSMTTSIEMETPLRHSGHRYPGWLGVECMGVRAAVWIMRAMVASNVLARREGTVLFVPVNPTIDPNGDIAARALIRVFGLAQAKGSV